MPDNIPRGFRTVTPSLVVKDAKKAIEYYKRAFGAVETMRMETPMGTIGHAELKIGDSMIMLSDEFPGAPTKSPQSLGGTSMSIFLYVSNVDKSFEQAVAAGGKAHMPPADMFWGDRYGHVIDPFGHDWGLATHVKDVSPEEMKKGMAEMFKNMKTHAAG